MSTLFARLAPAVFLPPTLPPPMGYNTVTQGAAAGGNDVRNLMAALWIGWGIGQLLFGVIVAMLAKSTSPQRTTILLLAACYPLATVSLQLVYLGLIFPEALLGTTSALTIIAAVPAPTPRLTSAAATV